MTVDITDLTNHIHAAGYSAIVEEDLRGSLAGGPVNIAITRNNSTFTHLHLLTLSPLPNDPENTTHYFITHITIDQAITLRISKTMTAQELWHHIYDTRLKTIPTPKPYLKQRHHDAPTHPAHQRYRRNRPSRHQPYFTRTRQPT
jgi:hypothetical protein